MDFPVQSLMCQLAGRKFHPEPKSLVFGLAHNSSVPAYSPHFKIDFMEPIKSLESALYLTHKVLEKRS